MAMQAEADPFLTALSFEGGSSSLLVDSMPFRIYSGVYKGTSVSVVVNGKSSNDVDNVGTTPAALAAYLAIQKVKPDLVLCRCEQPLIDSTRKKLSLFCQVPTDHVISLHDISNIYRCPLLLAEQDVGMMICNHFKLQSFTNSMAPTLTVPETSLPQGASSVRLGS